MRPKKIYLNEEGLKKRYMCARMVSCNTPIGSCNVEYTDLSQVWHDASEEPDKSGSLVLFDNGVLVLVREYTSWEEVKSKYKFSKWAYFDSFEMTYKITFTDTDFIFKE